MTFQPTPSASTAEADLQNGQRRTGASRVFTQPALGFGQIGRRSRPLLVAALVAVIASTGACMSRNVKQDEAEAAPKQAETAPLPIEPKVDLARYMGPWFIVGAIGLGLEKGAHDPVETYTMNPDGTIATVFQYRQDGFEGELKTKVTRAWVQEGTGNAEWKVRTFWPLRQQYLISQLEPDYSAAIVAREARDYVWILSRKPTMSDGQYQAYLAQIQAMGYDMNKFERYPHNGLLPNQDASAAALPRLQSSPGAAKAPPQRTARAN